MSEQSRIEWPYPAPEGYVWHQPEAPYLAHETARIDPSAWIGKGAQIEAGAVIKEGTRIGEYVQIGEYTRIKDHNWIGAYACIGGRARIGARGAGYAHVAVGSYAADIYRDADGVVWLRYGCETFPLDAWTQERITDLSHTHEPKHADYYIHILTALVQAAPLLLTEEANDE